MVSYAYCVDAFEMMLIGRELTDRKGCGVTPQVAIAEAGHRIEGTVMSHAPGHMLVLDMTEEDI